MDCPKCAQPMEEVSFRDVDVDRCTACGGLWFDLLEHEDLKKIRGAAEEIDTGDPVEGKRQDQVRKVACPKCHSQMIAVRDPEQPHIAFEQCTVCSGVFMDAGEFTDFSTVTVSEFLRDLLT